MGQEELIRTDNVKCVLTEHEEEYTNGFPVSEFVRIIDVARKNGRESWVLDTGLAESILVTFDAGFAESVQFELGLHRGLTAISINVIHTEKDGKASFIEYEYHNVGLKKIISFPEVRDVIEYLKKRMLSLFINVGE